MENYEQIVTTEKKKNTKSRRLQELYEDMTNDLKQFREELNDKIQELGSLNEVQEEKKESKRPIKYKTDSMEEKLKYFRRISDDVQREIEESSLKWSHLPSGGESQEKESNEGNEYYSPMNNYPDDEEEDQY